MNQISLKLKIYAGFALLAGLTMILGLVSYLGLQKLGRGLSEIQRIEQVHAETIDLDRDVQEIQLQVDRMINLGHDSAPERVRKLHSRIMQRIANVKSFAGDQTTIRIFDKISQHVDEYQKKFDLAVVERQLRKKLVQVDLPTISSQADTRIEKLIDILDAEPDESAKNANSLNLAQCMAQQTKAHKSFLRYFGNPNTATVFQATSHMRKATESLDKIDGFSVEKAAIRESLKKFSKTGLRAVQATRSYLFYRNVVMASEQSEIAFYANKIRQQTAQQREVVSARAASNSARTKWFTGLFSAGAIIVSSLIAVRLAVLIVPPITRLKKTFTKLASGEALSSIPGTQRGDEIGEMAKAASFFNEQNLKTKELLANSNLLAQELESQAEELAASNEELDRFAYIASHDLKSPLRGIRQLASWIEADSFDLLPKKSRAHLQKMQARVEKMEQLLDDLLDYSRVGRIYSEAEEVDINDLVVSIVELLNNPAGVKINVLGQLPEIKTLRTPLNQVLMNLIGNAIKYNERGPQGQINIGVEPEDGFLRFSVSDNGPGIALENHERAFQMYQRVGKVSVEGSGMGLAMARKQVQLVGGSFNLESSLGQGARFEFTWPIDMTTKNQKHETEK